MSVASSEGKVGQDRPTVVFSIGKKYLLDAIAKASVLVPKTKSSSLHSYIFLRADNGKLTITLSHPEAYLQTTCEIAAELEADFSLKTQKLYNIIQASDKEITFSVQENAVEIRSGSSLWLEPQFDLKPMNCGVEDEKEYLEVETFILLTGLNTIKYAMENDSIRPSLYMVDCVNGRLRACNGFRYHEINLNIPGL